MKILTNQEYEVFRQLAQQAGITVPPRQDASSQPNQHDGKFLAKITSYSSTTGYSWKRVYPDPTNKGKFLDWSPAETGDNAWERNESTSIANNTVVELQVVDYENSGGKPRFEFIAAGGAPGATLLQLQSNWQEPAGTDYGYGMYEAKTWIAIQPTDTIPQVANKIQLDSLATGTSCVFINIPENTFAVNTLPPYTLLIGWKMGTYQGRDVYIGNHLIPVYDCIWNPS